ncbi:MAG: nicotinate-nucleotide adenylyltransferase [Pseudomonadota bacterium]
MKYRGPLALPGQRIGLLGGSFDPPHAGHLHITDRAFRQIGLDWIWWLVSPGNPLKKDGPASIDRRVDACRALVRHPRVVVTDIERHLPSAFTANTLMHLSQRYGGVRFVWLMGADNLTVFHRWEGWQWIMENWPIAVFARPGEQVRAGLSPAARQFSERRLAPEQAKALARRTEARWCLLTGPMSRSSSTAIRDRGDWDRRGSDNHAIDSAGVRRGELKQSQFDQSAADRGVARAPAICNR